MQSILRIICLATILLTTSNPTFAQPTSTEPQTQKTILVTGASTGIGRKITEVLAANGYFVYAGARKKKTSMP